MTPDPTEFWRDITLKSAEGYTWGWEKQRRNYEATIHFDGFQVITKNFPIGTEPDVMAAWAKGEIQVRKLKDLIAPPARSNP